MRESRGDAMGGEAIGCEKIKCLSGDNRAAANGGASRSMFCGRVDEGSDIGFEFG
jgi:hypothetical protein